MPVNFYCSKCNSVLQAEPSWSGSTTQCPFCKESITIPNLQANNQEIKLPPPNSGSKLPPPLASANKRKDFFLITIFDNIFDKLRELPLLSKVEAIKNIITMVGGFTYVVLGVMLLIMGFIAMEDNSSILREIFLNVKLFLTIMVSTYVGMLSFKLYKPLASQYTSISVSRSLVNILGGFALCACIFYLIESLTDGSEDFNSYFNTFIQVMPILLVCISPATINLTLKNDNSYIEELYGLCQLALRTMLFVIPFMWAYKAIYTTLFLLLQLDGTKRDVSLAYNTISSSDLYMDIAMPIIFYVAYLFLNFIFSAIKNKIDKKEI